MQESHYAISLQWNEVISDNGTQWGNKDFFGTLKHCQKRSMLNNRFHGQTT